MQSVSVWEETVIIPTYNIGDSEKNPMFLEKRVYQGSSGVVYPHAVIEKIEDTKEDKAYQALFLENKYLKIMVLPELGGRIQMAYDKVRQRHFVYYNQVIKPALVGLTGPWISGGIEFNWPQHHRPSTFEPVDFTLEHHEDGSKTIWVSEVERMFSTKGMAGFTLHPDKAYLEIKGVLYNRTNLPQTFLWWANPAVKVNDDYQSVFPPDVYAVFDHGKRDVSSFPIATGTYYKIDYSPGTDISGYKNIPVPTSYMAIKSKYDFMGGYENDTQAGLLHVANHHVSPGKKQWTWGNGEFGYAWDRNLTDEDGPYIELMTGVFTDNQPDFSWIMPNEERRFVQYFMPYSHIGQVKNATKEAAVNLEVKENGIRLMAYTTTEEHQARIQLKYDNELIFEKIVDLSPADTFDELVDFSCVDIEKLHYRVLNQEGKELVSYIPETRKEVTLPEPAMAAKAPTEVENNEQLFLTGQHIEQYRHATYLATDYYQEALRRDEKDIRCNNAMGSWYYKRGKFTEAKPYFEKAIQTQTARNPNPYDSEAYYNLGLCLKQLDENEAAYEVFYKATWSAAWQDVAFLELAKLAAMKQEWEVALELVSDSLYRNWKGHNARHLKVALLRKLGKTKDALALIKESIQFDKFSMGCLFEDYLLSDATEQEEKLQAFKKLMRGNVHTYLEYTADYLQAGMYQEAQQLLKVYLDEAQEPYPIVYYFLAFIASKTNQQPEIKQWLMKAQQANPDKVFPNRLVELNILRWATDWSPEDGNLSYYLGNFWYANRQDKEAVACWEKTTLLKPQFPTAFRNLSLAYHNKEHHVEKAVDALTTAYQLDKSDARVLMEFDQLHKKINTSPQKRLNLLLSQKEITFQRDDLYLELVTLLNQTEHYQGAKDLLAARNFHPWEGGEGKVVGQYLLTHLALAKQAILAKHYDIALIYLQETEAYPHNLGEGKLLGTQENDIHYLKGLVYELKGDSPTAEAFYRLATQGIAEPVQAIFYNDPQPDKIFYQGLAWIKLGYPEKATAIFERLIRFGQEHLNDEIKIDYFAVSLPDLLVFDADLNERNRVHCLYLMALGHLGKGNQEEAKNLFNQASLLNINHQGVLEHDKMIDFLTSVEVLG